MTDFLCPTCGPINEDDGLLVGPGDAVCCAFCGCVEEEMVPLVDAYNAVVQERDQAYADIAEMVEKAADKHLAGYRELGSRAAEAETARDNTVLQASMWAQEARTQRAIVKEIGELVGCENDWEMVGAVREALAARQAQGEAGDYEISDGVICYQGQELSEEELLDTIKELCSARPPAPAAVLKLDASTQKYHDEADAIFDCLTGPSCRTPGNSTEPLKRQQAQGEAATGGGPLAGEYDTWRCDDCDETKCEAVWHPCDCDNGTRDGETCEDCCGSGGGHVCRHDVVAYHDPRPSVDWGCRFLNPAGIDKEDNRRFFTVPLYAHPSAPAAVPEELRVCYFCNEIRGRHWGDHEACPDIAPHVIDGVPDTNQRFRPCGPAAPAPAEPDVDDILVSPDFETEAMVDAACAVFEEANSPVDTGWLGAACRAYVKASSLVMPTPAAVTDGWRPIITAPKDGTTLLLRSKKNRVCDGKWVALNSDVGYWAWALVNQEPVEWAPMPDAAPAPAEPAPAAVPEELRPEHAHQFILDPTKNDALRFSQGWNCCRNAMIALTPLAAPAADAECRRVLQELVDIGHIEDSQSLRDAKSALESAPAAVPDGLEIAARFLEKEANEYEPLAKLADKIRALSPAPAEPKEPAAVPELCKAREMLSEQQNAILAILQDCSTGEIAIDADRHKQLSQAAYHFEKHHDFVFSAPAEPESQCCCGETDDAWRLCPEHRAHPDDVDEQQAALFKAHNGAED